MDLRKAFDKKSEKKTAGGRPEHVSGAAFDQVVSEGGPVLADFWASWCAPCRLLGGLLEEVGPEYAGRLRIVKVDVDADPEIAGRFGIRSIPTMILFHGGRPVDAKVGALPLHPLRSWLDEHLAKVTPASRGEETAAPPTAGESK